MASEVHALLAGRAPEALNPQEVNAACDFISELTSVPKPAMLTKKRQMVSNWLEDNGGGRAAAAVPPAQNAQPRAAARGASRPESSRGGAPLAPPPTASTTDSPPAASPRSKTKPSSGLLSARPKPGTMAATDSSSALLVRVHGAVKQGQGWLHSLEEARILAREINALTAMPVGIDVQQYVADWYNWQRWQTRSGWPLEPKCDRPAGQPMPGRPVFGFNNGAMRMPSFGGGMLAPAHALHYGGMGGGMGGSMGSGMVGGMPGSARLGLGMPAYDPRAQAQAQQLAMERVQLESERRMSTAHLERQRQELEAQRSALGGMMSMMQGLSSNLTSSVSQAFKGGAGVPEEGELRPAGQRSGAQASGRSGKKHVQQPQQPHHPQQQLGGNNGYMEGMPHGYGGHGGYPPDSYAAEGYDPRYGPPVSTRYSGVPSSQRRMPFLQQQALESAQGQAMVSQRASAQELAPDGQPYLRLPFGHFGGRSVESV